MARTIDYKYKSFVLKTNMHKYVGLLDTQLYNFQENGIIPTLDINAEYYGLQTTYGAKFIKECHRINNANYERIKRLKERITRYINCGTSIFVTLTFNNKTLDQTNEVTRRKYVQRFLKEHSDMYVANIDYGADDRFTHREHYHALVVCERIDKKLWDDYGFSFCEVVHKSNSETLISKYIAKLCNHAIKESTKRACYIYSRS